MSRIDEQGSGKDCEQMAIEYAIGVLTYMQNGGKLSSIEATASEIVRLAGQEVDREVPGPVRAKVLMGSVEEMRLRHNNPNADDVFSDMMAQARDAGRIRNEEKQMVSFTSIAADVVTAHESGTYRQGANAAADNVVKAIGKYGKWVVLAASELIRLDSDDAFEDIPADKVMEFMEESYLHAGATVSHALETYAKNAGGRTELGRLYNALDKAGGVGRFDWGSYADDGMTPTIGLHFVVMPVPAGESGTFIFGS